MKRLTLLADINTVGGYGQHAIQIVRDLERLAKVWVGVRCASRWEPAWGEKIPDDIKRKIVTGPQPEPWELLLHAPNFAPTPGKRTVYFSMNESTKLRPMGPHLLNRAEVVIVPCAWNASCFSAAGVTAPIQIVPLGINPNVFRVQPLPDHHPELCVFGVAGSQANGARRKGLGRAVELFQRAFPNDSTVRLKVKALPDYPILPLDDSRIEVCNRWMSEAELAAWYATLTCFVSLACGEGWGLMQQQAMATGRPLVSPCFGGLQEFFERDTGWEVPYRLVDAGPHYDGLWAWCDDRDVIAVLREVAARPEEARRRGRAAAAAAREFTWERSVLALIKVLEKYGALSLEPPPVNVASKAGVMAYLPPEGIGHTDVFLQNLREYPPKLPVVYLTDGHWPGLQIPTPSGAGSDAIASEVFTQAIQYARSWGWEYLIWLETDCRVKGDGWDAELLSVMRPDSVVGGNLAWCGNIPKRQRSRRCEPGRILQQAAVGPQSVPFVNGAPACYHVERTFGLIERMTWRYRIQDRQLGEEAVREFGRQADKCFVHVPEVMAAAGERMYLPTELRHQLMLGRAIAVHPIKNRWRPAPPGGHVCHHSGDLGDIVYALKAMSLLGSGVLNLGNDCAWTPPRQPLTEQVYAKLRPLLERQKYVSASAYVPTRGAPTIDFNLCRKLWQDMTYRNRHAIHNLCEMYCRVAGVEFNHQPWLKAGRKTVARVIFARSARWHGEFPWREAVVKHGREAVFVGLPEEHREFTQAFGHVDYYPVDDFAELAAVINGATLFVGNQSLPCSLALGLGVTVWQETSRASPDCLFLRPNFFNQTHPPGEQL